MIQYKLKCETCGNASVDIRNSIVGYVPICLQCKKIYKELSSNSKEAAYQNYSLGIKKYTANLISKKIIHLRFE